MSAMRALGLVQIQRNSCFERREQLADCLKSAFRSEAKTIYQLCWEFPAAVSFVPCHYIIVSYCVRALRHARFMLTVLCKRLFIVEIENTLEQAMSSHHPLIMYVVVQGLFSHLAAL